jgi:hypothetical protein
VLAVAIALAWGLGVEAFEDLLGLEDDVDPLVIPGAEYLTTRGREAADQIADTTEQQIGRSVLLGLAAGWLLGAVVDAVAARFARYRESRIPGIATYETLEAYERGGYNAAGYYSATGLEVEKSNVTMRDKRVEQECRDNEAQGWLPANQPFQSGHQRPLFHHRCRCLLAWRLAKQAEE